MMSHPPYGLSPSQARNLLEETIGEAGSGLNIEQVVCRTREALDLDTFQRAWQMILERHSALRVRFGRDEQDEPYQQIAPAELMVRVDDLQSLREAEREAFLEDWLERDRQAGFDLARAPLMRVTVLRFAGEITTWVWTFHHILLDGRSILLVMDDFFACYEALGAKREAVLPQRPHFSEYVAWHQRKSAAEEGPALAHWQKLFAGDESNSVLSIGRTAPGAHYRQEKIALRIDAELAKSLRAMASDFELTLNAVVQGAWALLLGRYYRSTSVTFSTLRACRHGSVAGADGMIGMLMNFCPVRVAISETATVAEYLKAIRAQAIAARDVEWTPWELLQKALPVPAKKQLFDSCVLFERYHLAQEMTDRFGLKGARVFTLRERSNVPLLLTVSERPNLQMELVYQTRLFAAEEMGQLARSLVWLLRQMAAQPKEPVATLTLLDADDQAKVIRQLTGPQMDVPANKGLHHGFEEQARKTPGELAVVAECTLTYDELNRRADHLAGRLVAAGAGPDKVVVVFIPRSAMAVLAMLGVLKSGAAYFAIDVEIPKVRIQSLLDDAQPCAIVTEASFAPALPVVSVPVVRIGKDDDVPAASTPSEKREIKGSDLAYVVHTSGTTGRPKLIGVEHRQASNLLAFATQSLLRKEDVRFVPFIDSPHADSSISQIFTTLSLGGTLVLVADLLSIQDSPYHDKFTCLGSTPSILTVVLKATGLPPAVRLIGLGAEAIPADLLEKIEALPQVKKVINYYGPSEATVYCTVSVLLDRTSAGKVREFRDRGRNIGRPIANTRVYLVDDMGQLAPPGALGEIFVAGAAVARGYIGLPAKQATSFVADRFSGEPGERMYRTGDMGQLLPDGQIEFHGRKDHQLKFNGVRIEPAEIEHALLKATGVLEAVVDLRAEAGGKKRLVAYLVVDAARFSKQEMRKFIRLVVPAGMIPQRFVILKSLPLTSNGKADRAALAQMEVGFETVEDATSIATPMEARMRALWEENLGRSPIGLDQDYFECGGDSLSAVNLLVGIEKRFGVKLKPQQLLKSSTIAELANEMERLTREAGPVRGETVSSFAILQAAGVRAPLVLIPGGSGESFLSYKSFAQNLFPDHPVYALQSPYALILDDPVDPVRHLAGHFAAEIVRQVAGEPFVLFGHCVGGLLAWHIACVLQEEKAPPFRLVLYDSPVPLKGFNARLSAREGGRRSRFRRVSEAYRLAWIDWRMRHGGDWKAKAGFVRWALNNAVMRKGWDRSEDGRNNFAKLGYLRLLQVAPLGMYSGDALMIYHDLHAEAVSKSLWRARSSGDIAFEFIPGAHSEWENAIHHTIPLLRRELEALAAREAVAV